MRIIAGLHKGRKLKSIKGDKIRPTTDRVREAIFNVLAERLPGAVVLDLFAGSGALGIEALSRGALHAVFADKDFDAVRLVRANLELIGESSRSTVLKGDIFRVCERLGREHKKYDLIFADPPYNTNYHQKLIDSILNNNLLATNGIIVYETRHDYVFSANLEGLLHWRIKAYGDTKIWFFDRLSDMRD